MTYEEPKWAEALNYKNQNTDDALQIFKLTRKTTYRLLGTLPNEIFRHSVVHPEYDEPYTFEKWLILYARHVPDHIE